MNTKYEQRNENNCWAQSQEKHIDAVSKLASSRNQQRTTCFAHMR